MRSKARTPGKMLSVSIRPQNQGLTWRTPGILSILDDFSIPTKTHHSTPLSVPWFCHLQCPTSAMFHSHCHTLNLVITPNSSTSQALSPKTLGYLMFCSQHPNLLVFVFTYSHCTCFSTPSTKTISNLDFRHLSPLLRDLLHYSSIPLPSFTYLFITPSANLKP